MRFPSASLFLRAAPRTGLIAALAAALWLPSAGCERYGGRVAAGEDTLQVALPAPAGHGSARLFLYRITSLRSGERLGVGRAFAIEPDRQVRAVLQLDGADTHRDLLFHVQWLNPDRSEVFTKETLIRASDWSDAGRRQELAQALIFLEPEGGRLEMESRYGVDPIRIEEEIHKAEEDRRFKPGVWFVRVYLFRKLLLETSFELVPQS